jgi:hypothetical protein
LGVPPLAERLCCPLNPLKVEGLVHTDYASRGRGAAELAPSAIDGSKIVGNLTADMAPLLSLFLLFGVA